MSDLPDLRKIDIQNATPEQIESLKNLSDEDLLRASNSIDLFAVVEAVRRLRVTLHREEVAIKRLTWALAVFTLVLVGLGVAALMH
jgi:hypothetical protein